MVTDDVDLFRLVENVRYLTKRSTMDNQIRDRIFSCLDAFDAIINCDIKMAYDMVRDLIIIRALIKKDSEDLDRKFTIFEQKLRKVAETVLPRDEGDEIRAVRQPVTTTIFQDNEIRIIDIVNRKNALNKMEDCKDLVSLVKEIIKLSESPVLPMTLRCDTRTRMNDILNLMKIDGSVALKLKKDVTDTKNALKKGQDGEIELENRLIILKLKLEKCSEELHRKEEEHGRLIQLLDDNTMKAVEMLDASIKRPHTEKSKSRQSVNPDATITDCLSMGVSNAAQFNPPSQIPPCAPGLGGQMVPMQATSLQGFMLVPMTQPICPPMNMQGYGFNQNPEAGQSTGRKSIRRGC